MAWLEITVQTEPDNIEKCAEMLTAQGFSDLVLEDQQEFQEFLEDNREYWDYIDEELEQKLQGLSQIKLYLEEEDEMGLAKLRTLLDPGRINVAKLEETNWEESWKDNYPPQEIGENLVVLPCWLADSYEGSRTPVILDPGLTFGTGAHPSTRMVMGEMEKAVKPGANCLDLGSGSGILSITALRLGAKKAVGVDIDPKAEDIARENAAYNGFSAPAFTAITGNVTENKKMMGTLSETHWDVVLVNIVADVIIGLSPVLPEFLGKDTTLILSGILHTRLEDVQNALRAAGIRCLSVREDEDWRCITACRM